MFIIRLPGYSSVMLIEVTIGDPNSLGGKLLHSSHGTVEQYKHFSNSCNNRLVAQKELPSRVCYLVSKQSNHQCKCFVPVLVLLILLHAV